MAEIMLYGAIGEGDLSAKIVVQKIQAMKAGQPLVVAINSAGGNFFDGEAIYNAIRRYKGRKVIRVDAVAASAASYVAMAGDEIVMAPGAHMMVHRPSIQGFMIANEDDLRDIIARFDTLTKQMIRVYAQRSGLDEARVKEMVHAETWLTAEQCMQLGFCDRVDDDLELAALYDSLDRYRYRHVPVAVSAILRSKADRRAETEDDDETDASDEPAAGTKDAKPKQKATVNADDSEALRARRARIRQRMRTYAHYHAPV